MAAKDFCNLGFGHMFIWYDQNKGGKFILFYSNGIDSKLPRIPEGIPCLCNKTTSHWEGKIFQPIVGEA
jgi:hypothetical protein